MGIQLEADERVDRIAIFHLDYGIAPGSGHQSPPTRPAESRYVLNCHRKPVTLLATKDDPLSGQNDRRRGNRAGRRHLARIYSERPLATASLCAILPQWCALGIAQGCHQHQFAASAHNIHRDYGIIVLQGDAPYASGRTPLRAHRVLLKTDSLALSRNHDQFAVTVSVHDPSQGITLGQADDIDQRLAHGGQFVQRQAFYLALDGAHRHEFILFAIAHVDDGYDLFVIAQTNKAGKQRPSLLLLGVG